jgi:hypothetical protein
MNKLTPETIKDLADRFLVMVQDSPRQDIIDQLGNHPVNHAWFGRYLADHHPNDWQVYLSLTNWIK